ncbi:MAG: tetratricopeptide repeat protein, partial [Alloprevotella tannerae]|nr:tetratricopeptide repeat protein [Alloprevotella tannerae]
MRLTDYLSHPEALDKRTLFQLRETIARHPYDAVARLLFLKNLFLLHDPSFGDELRRAALFVPDRSVLYAMVEEKNRLLQPVASSVTEKNLQKGRTLTLIDDFINNTGAPTVPVRR